MKESPSRVVALTAYTLRTKTGRVRVEDDGPEVDAGRELASEGRPA